MIAADVMVCNVITVRADTSVEKIAETLLANRISAVPVVNEAGGLVGIVSEGDLIIAWKPVPSGPAHGGSNSRPERKSWHVNLLSRMPAKPRT